MDLIIYAKESITVQDIAIRPGLYRLVPIGRMHHISGKFDHYAVHKWESVPRCHCGLND